jgi:hypothetical protein
MEDSAAQGNGPAVRELLDAAHSRFDAARAQFEAEIG